MRGGIQRKALYNQNRIIYSVSKQGNVLFHKTALATTLKQLSPGLVKYKLVFLRDIGFLLKPASVSTGICRLSFHAFQWICQDCLGGLPKTICLCGTAWSKWENKQHCHRYSQLILQMVLNIILDMKHVYDCSKQELQKTSILLHLYILIIMMIMVKRYSHLVK